MPSRNQEPDYGTLEKELEAKLCGGRRPIVISQRFSTYHCRGYTMPGYVAYAQYRKYGRPTKVTNLNVAAGIGESIEEASVKSLVEAYERYYSGKIRVDLVNSKDLLPYPVYDISESAPQRLEFTQKEEMFSPSRTKATSWVLGERLLDGHSAVAPIDQVFYPLSPKSARKGTGYRGTSSGVAAHFTEDQAIENAMLELIERDAIAVTWYSRRIPSRIPEIAWADDIKSRAVGLKTSARREVIFCNLTLDSVPVILCVIQGPTYPYLAIGSSAKWDYVEAMRKALDEAELMFHTRRGYPVRKRDITPFNVRDVEDHARLWSLRSSVEKLSWMIAGKQELPSLAVTSWKSILDKFEPAVFRLRKRKTGDLSVVRVVSNILMPLTFGFGSEHYRHPRVKMLGFQWATEYPALPHCLA